MTNRNVNPIVHCDKFVIGLNGDRKKGGTYRLVRTNRNQIPESFPVINGKSDRRSKA